MVDVNIAHMFKRKASELVSKLQARFPGRLMFASVALTQADEQYMLDEYITRVHHPYGDRIKARDEQFFLTTDGIDDPLNVTTMLRGLWGDMTSADRDVVWRYLDIFERLASKVTLDPAPRT